MKDHHFLRDTTSDNDIPLCAFCSRPESEHASLIECDVCHKPDFCTKFLSMMMCASCKQNEQKLQEISRAEASRRVEESIKSMNPTHDNISEVIRYNSEFYNATVISLDQLRSSILSSGGTEFDYAAAVEARINHLQLTIIPGLKKSVEQANSELHISQKMLNDTVAQFRAEERAKFKSADINYKPITSKEKKVKVPTIKSKDPMDALAAQYLAIMEKRGTPIKSVYEVYHDGNLLYKGKDQSLANIKAKESKGIVKEITPFMVAKLRAMNGFTDDEGNENETIN